MDINYSPIFQALKKLKNQEPLCAYVYDLKQLREHAENIKNTLPENVSVFYAAKANSEIPILNVMAQVLDGVEIASIGELKLMQQAFAQVPLIMGGPGKCDFELEAAVDAGVSLIHVESLFELERLSEIVRVKEKKQNILLRMNLGLPSHQSDNPMIMVGKPTAFGMSEDCLPKAMEIINKNDYLSCNGSHFHLLSLQLNVVEQLELLHFCCEKVLGWEQQFGIKFKQINLGGGIGVNYQNLKEQFAWSDFVAGLNQMISKLGLQRFQLRFEFGRYLAAFCGYYAMEVLDIKRSHGEQFLIARGGSHHFRTPCAQGHSHPFIVMPWSHWQKPYQRPRVSKERVNVVGQLCTPKDRLATNHWVEAAAVGDILVFPLAGAYAWNISHQQFLSHPKPVMHFID